METSMWEDNVEDIPERHPCVSGGFENCGYEGCDQSVPLVLCRRERKWIQGKHHPHCKGLFGGRGDRGTDPSTDDSCCDFFREKFLAPICSKHLWVSDQWDKWNLPRGGFQPLFFFWNEDFRIFVSLKKIAWITLISFALTIKATFPMLLLGSDSLANHRMLFTLHTSKCFANYTNNTRFAHSRQKII